MKKVLLFALIALAVSSCTKEKNGGSYSTLPVSENFSALTVRTSGQVVKMAVTSNVLNMIYNEDVTLILDSAKLSRSYAVHLKEDFTGTQLAKYDYHSLTRNGLNATNWVDDNLNNIVVHSSIDTLIAGKVFVKKRITRSFLYQLAYNSSADATVVMQKLLKQTDIISFSAWYAPGEDQTAPTTNTAKLTYVRL